MAQVAARHLKASGRDLVQGRARHRSQPVRLLRAQPDYKDGRPCACDSCERWQLALAEVADVYGVILGADIERALKMKRVTHLYAHRLRPWLCQ